ncbi:hypothetical protein R1sor_003311 [Riccia sorocarpa]|uniref:Uncharacterized protein n=1 Tax=Riccia sorocarpa TaxID=122646 RepID=A0ABD3H422_9MARC
MLVVPDREGRSQKRRSPQSVLYDHSICEHDVLILDNSVQKNSTNHPSQALHPHTFDHMKTAKKDDNYLNSVLLHVLDKFRFHRQDVMSFVEANWQAAQAQEPFGKITTYWGTMDARDEAFIWSNCKASDRYVFRDRLDEHRIKHAMQTATDPVTAEENWPWQHPNEAGPSQDPDSELAELGRPLVPAPLTRIGILSETKILLSGSRDEDEELARGGPSNKTTTFCSTVSVIMFKVNTLTFSCSLFRSFALRSSAP